MTKDQHEIIEECIHLKSDDPEKDFKLKALYVKEDVDEISVFGIAYEDGDSVNFIIGTKGNLRLSNWGDWAYSLEDDLDMLSDGYEILYMSPTHHHGMWFSIAELYPIDIENKKGMYKYMEFCKVNGVTKSFIEKSQGFELPSNILDIYDKEYPVTKDLRGKKQSSQKKKGQSR